MHPAEEQLLHGRRMSHTAHNSRAPAKPRHVNYKAPRSLGVLLERWLCEQSVCGVDIEYGKWLFSSVITVECCFPSFVFVDWCQGVSQGHSRQNIEESKNVFQESERTIRLITASSLLSLQTYRHFIHQYV